MYTPVHFICRAKFQLARTSCTSTNTNYIRQNRIERQMNAPLLVKCLWIRTPSEKCHKISHPSPTIVLLTLKIKSYSWPPFFKRGSSTPCSPCIRAWFLKLITEHWSSKLILDLWLNYVDSNIWVIILLGPVIIISSN